MLYINIIRHVYAVFLFWKLLWVLLVQSKAVHKYPKGKVNMQRPPISWAPNSGVENRVGRLPLYLSLPLLSPSHPTSFGKHRCFKTLWCFEVRVIPFTPVLTISKLSFPGATCCWNQLQGQWRSVTVLLGFCRQQNSLFEDGKPPLPSLLPGMHHMLSASQKGASVPAIWLSSYNGFLNGPFVKGSKQRLHEWEAPCQA